MIKRYIGLRLKVALRMVRELHVFTLVVLALLGVLFYALSFLSPYGRLGIYAALVLAVHVARSDRYFLQLVSHHREYRLFAIDYLSLSVPFVASSLACLTEAVAIPLAGVCMAFLPISRIHVGGRAVSLFPRGSMEYERGLRMMAIFLTVFLAGAVVGVIEDNLRISLVATLISLCFVYPLMFGEPVNFLYMRNYASVGVFLKNYLRHAAVNTLMVWLPFALLLCLGTGQLRDLLLPVQIYIVALLLVVQMGFLRILCHGNIVMWSIGMLMLGTLGCLVVYSPWVILMQMLMACLLCQFSLSTLKILIDGYR
uniref:Beta-carotene 15,15'-monooxygenase n=1 Tax=Prevotella sp. GTC17259 TaxID=3236795 RepID=A0AB33J9Y7_9BACT